MSRRATLLLMSTLVVTATGAGELGLVPAAAQRWCLTRGRVTALASGGAHIDDPKVRVVMPGSDGNAASLRFAYRGPTGDDAPLASGEIRRQIGLKLRAQDGCNLVYVMWRIEPVAQIVVSVKRNPGQRTHRECGARGYRNLRGDGGVQPPPLQPGRAHTLAATIDERARRLRVWADGALAWDGALDDDALASVGPAGLRSDNGRFEGWLEVRPGRAVACGEGGNDED